MGKNFSLNNTGGKRRANDDYPTPLNLTREFLNVADFDFSKPVLEPCCGSDLAMVKVLKEYFTGNVESYDIISGVDFYNETRKFNYLITNPPYRGSTKWIKKCKEVVTDSFALLLPVSYLQGKERYDTVWMDKTFPLSDLYVFDRFPMFGDALSDNGKFRTGMMCAGFYVWKKGCDHPPYIHWIDIDKYIERKSDYYDGQETEA